ncbi:MAG: hypothetical protein GX787_02605 [Tissierellia bacterium]|nr:hypothetical protein [Tissierellia bacterium]
MKLIYVSNKNKKDFINFYEDRYLNNPLKRNSMSGLLKDLLNGKSQVCKMVDLEPVMVVDNSEIIMISVLAYAHRLPEFLQIGFFEACKFDINAFKLILNRAETLAKEKGARKISGSLNIHVNYGLGFLASDYDKKQSFGMPHNPQYYHYFFRQNSFNEIPMVSYKKDMSTIKGLFNERLIKKLEARYSVRGVNFKDLKNEAQIYTEINNKAFEDHLFYYKRKAEEDLELFKDFQFLLKSENLLFVEKNGEPVGFMLWYPDFHQLMKENETIGLKTVIKNKIYPNKIKTFKIVEMGVIPQEQNKGAILVLFNHCFGLTKDKYDSFQSGWVLENNFKSKSFGIKWSDGEDKYYKAYIKDVE